MWVLGHYSDIDRDSIKYSGMFILCIFHILCGKVSYTHVYIHTHVGVPLKDPCGGARGCAIAVAFIYNYMLYKSSRVK